jgi:hypothetical protein
MTKTYEELLTEGKAHYKAIKQCYCPILKSNIIFNSKGFNHFKYKGNHARAIKEQMYKIGLIPLIKPVIIKATKIHKYSPPVYSKSEKKYVEYWVLQEIVGRQNTMVTVVLRKIGTGNITFYSVWKKDDRKNQKNRRKK